MTLSCFWLFPPLTTISSNNKIRLQLQNKHDRMIWTPRKVQRREGKREATSKDSLFWKRQSLTPYAFWFSFFVYLFIFFIFLHLFLLEAYFDSFSFVSLNIDFCFARLYTFIFYLLLEWIFPLSFSSSFFSSFFPLYLNNVCIFSPAFFSLFRN